MRAKSKYGSSQPSNNPKTAKKSLAWRPGKGLLHYQDGTEVSSNDPMLLEELPYTDDPSRYHKFTHKGSQRNAGKFWANQDQKNVVEYLDKILGETAHVPVSTTRTWDDFPSLLKHGIKDDAPVTQELTEAERTVWDSQNTDRKEQLLLTKDELQEKYPTLSLESDLAGAEIDGLKAEWGTEWIRIRKANEHLLLSKEERSELNIPAKVRSYNDFGLSLIANEKKVAADRSERLFRTIPITNETLESRMSSLSYLDLEGAPKQPSLQQRQREVTWTDFSKRYPLLAKYPSRSMAEEQDSKKYKFWCDQMYKFITQDGRSVIMDNATSLAKIRHRISKADGYTRATKTNERSPRGAPWAASRLLSSLTGRKGHWTVNEVEEANDKRFAGTSSAVSSNPHTSHKG